MQARPRRRTGIRAEAVTYYALRNLASTSGTTRRRRFTSAPRALLGTEAVMSAAQDQLAADLHGDQPGRFGFDTAEFYLHLAEASLLLGDHTQARAHADASQQHIRHGRPGWAAAVLVQARGEAGRGRYGDAAALAHRVLDTLAVPALRETLRRRLRELDHDLFTVADPGGEARELRDRLSTLPRLLPPDRTSDEPNGR